MSISSCPRCAQPVTLPAGVSDHAQVRCPLCHAQYTLADAMANAPPLLVVVEEQPTDLPADWLAAAPPIATAQPIAPASADTVPDFGDELLSEPTAHAPSAQPAHDGSLAGSGQVEHDDFVMQERDTEVEDFNFASEPAAHEAPLESDPLDLPLAHEAPGGHDPLAGDDLSGSDDDSIFQLDEPAPRAAEPAADDMSIDFGDPQPIAEHGETEELSSLDFGESQEAGGEGEDGGLDFQFESAPEAGADDDLVPDFGEPAAAPALPVAAAVPEEPKGKKKDKKSKEKKQKAAKVEAGDKPPRKRSLVGTLASVLLPLFITVPLALYGLLWLGPDYDFFGIGKKFPAAMVPAAFNKPDRAAQIAKAEAAVAGMRDAVTSGQIPLPQGVNLPGATPEASEDAAADPAETPPAAAAAANTPPAEPAAGTPEPPATAAPPAEDVAATPADNAAEPPAEPAADAAPGPALADKEPAEAEMPAPADENVAATDKPAEAPGDLDSLLSDEKPAATPEDKVTETEITEALGPINPPEFTPGDLATAMQDVAAANEQMTAAQAAKDDAALKKARKDFYVNLFGLGQTATFVKDDSGQPQLDTQRRALAHLAANLAADPKRLEALKTNAARWFGFAKRTTPGIVLAGAVEEVEPAGKLFHTKIHVGEAADAPTVTVVSPHDPALNAGDQVIAIGSIVAHPEQELAGYDGVDTAVVWSAMTVKLPPAAK